MQPNDLHTASGVREGDMLAGKYRIERVLGVGGMGAVVAARHVQLESKVAIKFLLPHMLSNADAVARFAREARAAVKITSEHVARVIDVGTLDSGAPYMVMEFLEGGDLAGWLKQRGPLPVDQAVEFVLQACVAVADAHGLNIVHRDLKPANLFCVRRSDGQLLVKVLDFGISKMAGSVSEGGMSFTRTSSVMGSPLYMSPEQMQTPKDVDALTDIWALGVILYELITGRVPFDGETIAEVAVRAATAAPPPLRSFRPDAPAALEAVILRCLAKDRRGRYRNVAELALALVDFAPRRARASVERISGIIQAAGLSESALNLPPSPLLKDTQASPIATGTVAPVGRTSPGVTLRGQNGRTFVTAGALGAAALVAVLVAIVKPFGGAAPASGPVGTASSLPGAAHDDAKPAGPAPVPEAKPAPTVTTGTAGVESTSAPTTQAAGAVDGALHAAGTARRRHRPGDERDGRADPRTYPVDAPRSSRPIPSRPRPRQRRRLRSPRPTRPRRHPIRSISSGSEQGRQPNVNKDVNKMTRLLSRLSCAPVLCALAFYAPVAAGQGAPHAAVEGPKPLADALRGDARTAYDSANLLISNHDFAGALAKFKEAYLASAEPRLLYNMALCEKNLRHYASMQLLLRRYAREGAAQLTADDRAAVDAALAAIQNLVASLTVTVDVDGATILVDGVGVGQSPLKEPLATSTSAPIRSQSRGTGSSGPPGEGDRGGVGGVRPRSPSH